jgi:hypothetical protein
LHQSPQYPRKTPVDGPQRVVSATPTLTKLPTNRKTVKSCGPISASSSPSDSVAASCFSPNAYNFVNPLDHPFQNVQSGNSLDDGSFPTRTAGDIDPYRSQHMSEQVSELDSFKTSITITSSISPQDSRPPLFLPSDQITPSQGERMSFYNILNDILGPAHGLQESVGTYKAHMGEQTRRYFERLFPTSPSLNKHRSIYPIRSNLEPAPRADFSVDFRKWLLCGKTPFSSVRAASDSPQALVAQNPVLQQDSTTSTCNTPLFSPEVGPGSDTLDDLFPPLPLLQSSCIQDTIGSPVLRSKAMRRLRLSPPLEEQNLMISRVRSTGPPVAKENASYPGLAVPTSRLSSREKVYFLPTPSSSLLLSRSLCDDCVEAAMPSLTAQISAEPRKTHGHRGAIHDPAASPSGRYCAVTLKQVTELETGRIKRSDRMRTTSAGGGI